MSSFPPPKRRVRALARLAEPPRWLALILFALIALAPLILLARR